MLTFVYSRAAELQTETSLAGCFLDTEENWIAQSYLQLKNFGIDIALSSTPPEQGAFVAAAYVMPSNFRPTHDQFFISVSADGPPHLGGDLHIVQNKAQEKLLPQSRFIPHWPQPGLIGRDYQRGSKFENIVYIGDQKNLSPYLASSSWRQRLSEFGLNWIMQQQERRDPADMSEYDAVVAIRSFNQTGFIRKPASKLVNALLANCPAVCGREFAYREVAPRGSCYLEATSANHLLKQLLALKNDVALRSRIVENGRLAVLPYTASSVLNSWRGLVTAVNQKDLEWTKSASPYFRAIRLRAMLSFQYRILKLLRREQWAL